MNEFRIDVRTVRRDDEGEEYESREAWILVDGKPLFDLVADAERPSQTTEGAGDYVYPPPEVALSPSRHLLGEPAGGEWGEESVRGKIAIGGCTCGVVGCWPLLVRIDVEPNMVIWSDFENPFRSQGRHDPPDRDAWDWSSVGPFVFARQRYEDELSNASAAPNSSSTGR